MNDPYWSTMFNDTALQELDFLRTCFSLTPQHSTTGRDSTTASCCGRGGTGETQAPSRIKRLISRSVWKPVYQCLSASPHWTAILGFYPTFRQTQRMKSLTKEWLSCAMPRRYSVLWNLLQGMISKYVFSVYNIYSFINMALSAAIRELHAGRGPSVTWRMTCTCHAPFSDTPSCRSAFWHWDLQAAKWWELWAFNGLRAILEMIELWNNTVWIASMESIYPAECITKPKGMICMMIVQGGNKIALFRYHITQESRVFVFQRN